MRERKRYYSNSGDKERKQYQWTKDENGEEELVETTPIDIQAEIESYADECDIKRIVQKASFDPQFAVSLTQGVVNGQDIDISDWPTNIHEYHRMMATAEIKAKELQAEINKPKQEPKVEVNKQNESE